MVIHNIEEKKKGLDQLCFPQIEDEVENIITEGKVPYTLIGHPVYKKQNSGCTLNFFQWPSIGPSITIYSDNNNNFIYSPETKQLFTTNIKDEMVHWSLSFLLSKLKTNPINGMPIYVFAA